MCDEINHHQQQLDHVPTNRNDITTQLTKQLVDRLGERPVAMWFKDTKLSVEDNRLQVRAGTRFAADWIRRRFGEELQRLAADIIDTDAHVDIDVNPEETRSTSRPSMKDAPATQLDAPDRTRVPRRASKRGPSMRFHQIDRFVVGSCNRLAWTAALQLTSDGEHSPVSPLFIHGGCGLGKTHLLQGLCRRVLELEGPTARVRYVTGEQFTNEYITAIRESTVDQFRARYRGLTLLAIDDVHFFRNKKKTQAEFMHTLDAIELTGARLALASDEHPSAIASFSKNLVSRFMSGMVVKVERPDLDTRLMLVQQLAQNQSLRLNEAATRLLASKCLDSIREIQGAITRLAAMRMIDPEHLPSDDPEQLLIPGFNDASDRVVGPVAIRRIFASTQWAPETPVPVSSVIEAVCRRTNVTPAELGGPSRHRRISLARSIVAYLARAMTTASYPEIAYAMGRANHSSIHAGARRITRKLDREPTITLESHDGGAEHLELAELLNELQREIRASRRPSH